ncbi:MAG: quinone-dependent dihydroorotate dehydrogenase [Gammaproteobacteria bacterium]|nr:quinone-dependent dihydroorotate dehydrogenase [Gammaproteobacteria bacterium]
MFYSLLKPFIFTQDAETAHENSLELLNTMRYLIPDRLVQKPVRVMGLEFLNPLGLAAGMDKNADYLPGLSRLGFGFIEVGTVTPRPQPGNPRPRLFRVRQHNSIINRMGFNNKGVDYLLNNIRQLPAHRYILGINIGKNLTTPVENALSDYRLAMQQVYTSADYITVNISSPNTPGLRNLQSEKALEELLKGIHETRKALQDEHQINRPIALKVAPDLDDHAIAPIADLLIKYQIDALIATNTTIDKSALRGHPLAAEAGGLSGEALTEKSRRILYLFEQQLQQQIPIISAGGIASAEEAQLRLDLGASLIQIYSALIFRGPGLIGKITKSIKP